MPFELALNGVNIEIKILASERKKHVCHQRNTETTPNKVGLSNRGKQVRTCEEKLETD